MATKKKKTKIGRPITGRTTVYFKIAVHKDFAEEAKELVKVKYQEWKQKQMAAGVKMPVYRKDVPKIDEKATESPKIPAVNPVEAKKTVSKAPKVAAAPVNEAAQSFLNKRREGKLK